jgi:hypothetical protein
MGPASRVRGIGGLVTTEALATATPIKPHGEPGGGGAIVQNNRVAQSIGEGALTVGTGDAGEGSAAVGGDRRARYVDGTGIAASRVVVGDHNLLRVIRVSPSECLGLDNIGRGLRAGDQVDIPDAIQGNKQSFDSLADALEKATHRTI